MLRHAKVKRPQRGTESVDGVGYSSAGGIDLEDDWVEHGLNAISAHSEAKNRHGHHPCADLGTQGECRASCRRGLFLLILRQMKMMVPVWRSHGNLAGLRFAHLRPRELVLII